MRVKSTNIFIAGKLFEMRVTPAQLQRAHIHALIIIFNLIETKTKLKYL